MAEDYDDLHQKINKKFIRNVIKPMRHAERHQDMEIPYQIPSASELFGLPRNSLPAPPPPVSSRQERQERPFQPSVYEGYPPESPPMETPRIRRSTPLVYATAPPTPQPSPQPPTPVMNCITICQHVQTCPVCSQLYRPYTGIYLAVIVILVIVILFLLKKIFQF